MKYLVGYSGFVGSNLRNSTEFDGLFDSKNVEESFGGNPDLLVYSGVPAQKFLANKEPEKDYKIIENAIMNIKKINPKKIVLISTIDVYKYPVNVDEDSDIDTVDLQPYGYNRYQLELWVKENFDDYLIVHLPGLYGDNIKKNFIYDLINIIPSMLTQEKYNELMAINNFLSKFYEEADNGFYKVKELTDTERKQLKEIFLDLGFSALNFTDSRGRFQFYNLSYLWEHIEIALKNNIKVLNLATEPVYISELYEYIIGHQFVNELNKPVPNYDYKTKHCALFNGHNGYIYNKRFIMDDIKKFVEERK